ncbi:AAA domain-containing protein [Neobacillus sp. PS3-40]|uniref:AAA domain-containing protein n=1 Tax=Neobacillus sp. PS3-40 TaxID=3070679 RepID=UPI0027DEC917|nr:AAA domain-containing protein [Neobacillus sp. PS3-40]WML45448.1 AAA domain-containing protein [Neobacillus sp. PS3-40]
MEQHLSKSFLKELCSYYMEFLESDFKASRIPSRRIKSEDQNIPLWHYSDYPLVISTLQNGDLPDIPYDRYATFLTEREIRAIQKSSDNTREILSSYGIEEEKIQKVERKREEEDFKDWLGSYPIRNFYSEFLSLVRDKELEDGLEIYLYIGRISYKDQSFPLFYGKVEVKQEDRAFHLSLVGDELFFNKKAVAYVIDRYRKETGTGVMPLPNRHLVLDQGIEGTIQKIVHDISDYFDLNTIDFFSREKSIPKKGDRLIHLSNDWMFTLFDKSDESIVNDYEELLLMLDQAESEEEIQEFSKLLTSFLFENPTPIDSTISESYEELPLSAKFSYQQPIPLNAEQQQLLSALSHPEGKYLVVEGPPGTGKSHTITAIIFDSLLKGKSVLMVSDKQEALDVVESKINETLDSMKLDDFVQNPVLRLGKQNNNFQKIFNQMNVSKIKTRQQTFRKKKTEMNEKLVSLKERIETNIEEERKHGKALDGELLAVYLGYEAVYEDQWKNWMYLGSPEAVYNDACILKSQKRILEERLGLSLPRALIEWKKIFGDTLSSFRRLSCYAEEQKVSFLFANDITKDKTKVILETIRSYEILKRPVIGHLFQGKKVRDLEESLAAHFYTHSLDLKKQGNDIRKEALFYDLCEKLGNETGIDFFEVIRKGDLDSILQELTSSSIEFKVINDLSILESPYMKAENIEIMQLEQYLSYQLLMTETGKTLLDHDFMGNRKEMENLLVCQMTNILDERMIGFLDHHRKDATLIRTHIKKKKPIPEELLRPLIEAFPCLILGIREIGDYLPFALGLFDIVIIDEASQVSIAQAFPAILRAKQVVVLGDPKQFGNVKSSQAAGDVNSALFKRVKDVFSQSQEGVLIEAVEHFNIKNSILEFIKSMANYHTILKKHFRGYSELIGYSNGAFYDGSLQVMKIRAKPVSDVIQFHILDSEKRDIRKNTNSDEVTFILNALKRLKDEGFEGTVGIITPFREQQKYLSDRISETTDSFYYKLNFRLKVMTFDSCQGEERDIVFYSMVERRGEDSLKYIFPLSFTDNEDNLKAQRLNVGFSRVKERAVFVLSKPAGEIRGEAGNALRKFSTYIEGKDHEQLRKELDTKSPMEEHVLHWITETPFYQENPEAVEIVPQFEIGAYVRQLDPSVVIPSYRVDFLVLCGSKCAIIEYDGYEFHFKNGATKDNYDSFYTDSDIERQRTIESYGYRFIRLNKFIARENPVDHLDREFRRHFTSLHKDNIFLTDASKVYQKIEKKEMKMCDKCGEVKELSFFFDQKLKTKYGRVCTSCKKARISV